MKIVATMLIGKLDEPFVTLALDSIAGLVDECVVQDNGMTAENLGRVRQSELYQTERLVFVPHPFVDFAFNRNLACAAARERSATWILRIDADELHRPEQAPGIVDVLRGASEDAIGGLLFHHMITPWHIQGDQPHPILLFHRPTVAWDGNVHEGLAIRSSRSVDYWVHHYGYVRPAERVFESWQLYEALGGRRQNDYSDAVKAELALCKGHIPHLLGGRKPLVTRCVHSPPEHMQRHLTAEVSAEYQRRFDALPSLRW